MNAVANKRVHAGIVALALSAQAAFFAAFRPAERKGHPTSPRLVPPHARYLSSTATRESAWSDRVLWSPLLLFYPSSLGFTRALLSEPISTRLTFSQPLENESFLATSDVLAVADRPPPVPGTSARFGVPAGLAAPSVPGVVFRPSVGGNDEPLSMDASLRRRLRSVPVLEAFSGVAPLRLKAEIRVAANGVVDGVFLDSPPASPAALPVVLKALYGLRFRPAVRPIVARVEIVVPESRKESKKEVAK